MSRNPHLLTHHAFVDLETTGLDPRYDEVIEVGIAFVEDDVESYAARRAGSESTLHASLIRAICATDDSTPESG